MISAMISLCNSSPEPLNVTFNNAVCSPQLSSINSGIFISNLSTGTPYTGTVTAQSGILPQHLSLYISSYDAMEGAIHWSQTIEVNTTTGIFQVTLIKPYFANVTFGYTYLQNTSNYNYLQTSSTTASTTGWSISGANWGTLLLSSTCVPLIEHDNFVFWLPDTTLSLLPTGSSDIRAYVTVTDPATGTTQTYTTEKQTPFKVLFKVADPT